MGKEEIELVPSGLVTCLLDNQEVRIIKLSPETLTVRTDEELKAIPNIKVAFYVFDDFKYNEIVLSDYKIIDSKSHEFYFTYVFSVNDEIYSENIRFISNDYYKYVMLKNSAIDSEFSEEMVGYPSDLDYDFYNFYNYQKREWMKDLNYNEEYDFHIMDNVELALTINNENLYRKYMSNNIENFKEQYLNDNYINNHRLLKKDVSRVYIGSEFCHNLFPEDDLLFKMLEKARIENLNITLCFSYMRDCYIEKIKNTLDKLYVWCSKNEVHIEIVINDWGMLELLKDKRKYFKVCLGVLLNKRKKDPRYMYKKGYKENKELMSKNSLNSSVFRRFLDECKIERYEYENCGYKMAIAPGNHSLHIPFYVTNTSQYCTLYAMCTNLDRGKQELVKNCPKYCTDYIFAYPKHLKMIGMYNSLFSFDDSILKDSLKLKYYIDSGIDRIVLNFL